MWKEGVCGNKLCVGEWCTEGCVWEVLCAREDCVWVQVVCGRGCV